MPWIWRADDNDRASRYAEEHITGWRDPTRRWRDRYPRLSRRRSFGAEIALRIGVGIVAALLLVGLIYLLALLAGP